MTTPIFPSSNPAPIKAPVFVSHAEPLTRDLIYDHRAAQAALPLRVHFLDGTSVETVLVLTPGQVEVLYLQTERAIGQRRDARRKDTEEREKREAAEEVRREGRNR